MLSIKQRIDALVARSIPASIPRDDDEQMRRARMVVTFALAIFTCCPMYGVLYAALGMTVAATAAFFCTVMLAVAPAVFKRTGSLAVGAHWVTAACWLTLIGVTICTGGIAAPAVGWFALVPFAALMLGGVKIGVRWTLVTVATVVAYAAIDALGATPAIETPVGSRDILRVSVDVGLVAIIAWLAVLYETHKDRMFATMRGLMSDVASARDTARTAHRDARLVLDHVGEALMTVDADGVVGAEHSRAATTFFGAIAPGARLWDVLRPSDSAAADWLELGWSSAFDDVLPVDVALAQLPARIEVPAASGAGARHVSLAYVALRDGADKVEKVLVVATDVTESIRAQAAETERREQLDVFGWIQRDASFVSSFVAEAEAMVAELRAAGASSADELRHLHTLKGNAGIIGLGRLASACHLIEDELRDRYPDAREARLDEPQRQRLAEAWRVARAVVDPLVGKLRGDVVVVDRAAIERLLERIGAGAPGDELKKLVREWSWEPAHIYLTRLAEQARALAARYHRDPPAIVVQSNEVRLPPAAEWGSFWSSTIHVVRNAIDHGIEPADERVAAGKTPTGQLVFRAVDSGAVTLELSDDGRGIDWDGVRTKASELGLPSASQQDLVAALFTDGLSTRAVATELSGRGVGLGAVAASAKALGGTVEIESDRGRGTTYRFRFGGPQRVGRRTGTPLRQAS